ncbi:MAG: SLBB domain-containing protein [Actinobacteria bacterium]|nr:SLBB domain-containing protein [Actinomycetota bacterium]
MKAVAARVDAVAVRRLLPTSEPLGWRDYGARYGSLPFADAGLLDEVEASGLTGRGGAGFPTAQKLRAVREGRRPVVVANGTEGEPASWKDKTLLRLNPHLVIDGALLAAELVGARRVVLAVGRHGAEQVRIARALAARPDGGAVELATVPERFVVGEESALVHWINGGEAKPTGRRSRPYQRGVDGRPTLVQNVETLANLALVARYGADWFRRDETVLATVGGAVRRPGVVEVPLGVPFPELFSRAGGVTEPVQAYLVGGYFGRWLPAQDTLRLTGEMGARVVVALPARSCGLVESARVVAYMAQQSAKQCGPCLFGLQALAESFATIARAEPEAAEAVARLERLERRIRGRGACAHPDGALGLAASAVRVFGAELSAHASGRCTAHDHEPVLPTPHVKGGWR